MPLFWPEQEGRDLQPVKASVADFLGHHEFVNGQRGRAGECELFSFARRDLDAVNIRRLDRALILDGQPFAAWRPAQPGIKPWPAV